MINIPDTVKVGGLTYDVVITDSIEGNECAAFIDTQKLQIKIEKTSLPSMQHSFIHEIIHAINSTIPEEEIEYLTMSFLQIIVDNPAIFNSKNGK